MTFEYCVKNSRKRNNTRRLSDAYGFHFTHSSLGHHCAVNLAFKYFPKAGELLVIIINGFTDLTSKLLHCVGDCNIFLNIPFNSTI